MYSLLIALLDQGRPESVPVARQNVADNKALNEDSFFGLLEEFYLDYLEICSGFTGGRFGRPNQIGSRSKWFLIHDAAGKRRNAGKRSGEWFAGSRVLSFGESSLRWRAHQDMPRGQEAHTTELSVSSS